MLAPIRARVASSCSRNGIQLVVIETIWFGATSTKLTLLFSTITVSPFRRAITLSATILCGLLYRNLLILWLGGLCLLADIYYVILLLTERKGKEYEAS